MVKVKRERRQWMRAANTMAFGLLAALPMPGCGSKIERATTGGETGFLLACDKNADCASGLCACGVCTKVCEEADDCSDGRATCSNAGACHGESRAVCLIDDSPSGATSAQGSTSSPSCRGQGHYQAGKEGSYLPCCDGLTEVALLSPAESDEGPVCAELPLRVYACVEGTCGDGTCEAGEEVPCGCADDCPSAAWGDADGGATQDGETTGDSSVDSECTTFGCLGGLLAASPGEVVIDVDLQGPFCGLSCGRATASLFEVTSGLPLHVPNIPMCDRCGQSPTSECQPSSVEDHTWRGQIGFADATCELAPGFSMECQSAPLYARAGRYRAELCTYPAVVNNLRGEAECPPVGEEVGTPICASAEFDYPSAEPVVLHLDNLPGSRDAGSATAADAGQ